MLQSDSNWDTHWMTGNFICNTPEQTFDLGEKFSRELRGGDVVLLSGELGAGKTLFAKGILHGLGYDADEVTSPSFTLVNLYKTNGLDVYHIDLWRLFFQFQQLLLQFTEPVAQRPERVQPAFEHG